MQSSSASSVKAGLAKSLESLSEQDLIELRADIKWAKTRLEYQKVPPGYPPAGDDRLKFISKGIRAIISGPVMNWWRNLHNGWVNGGVN